MTRPYILFVAAVYLGLGLGFLLAPAVMANGVGLVARDATALTDVRATYGGLELGLAALLLLFAARPPWRVAGLLTAVFTAGGFALGRGFGMVVDGVSGLLHPAFFVLELVLVGAGLLLLLRQWRRQRHQRRVRRTLPEAVSSPAS